MTNFVSVITIYNFDPSHTLFCPDIQQQIIFQVDILAPGSSAGMPAVRVEVWGFYYQVEMGENQCDGGNDEIKPLTQKAKSQQ